MTAERESLPNPTPRPEGELEALERAWAPPRGWRLLTAVNNTYIGLYYVGTAFLFFVFAGILALLMRAQLALPENDLIGHDLYNRLFTMHGTVMMFLFAVPAVEAMGVLLLPNLLAARDLPFPRLSAYAFWAYLIGGTVFLASLFLDLAPRAGWFMYPPLSSAEYTPDISADFWLLGIGFIEISAIAGAIEIIVGILRTRAPGMTLARMPVYAWAMLVFGGMIIFAFPAMIAGTALLEIERAFDWPFFIAERGGDPLLWQHLFWFFGHPEVYIIFIPAAGFVSMIVPMITGHTLVGYRLVVLALIATGFLSFGLWVHHMFTTGMPSIAMSFFSAASMAVAIPSGIQIFAWIATIAAGRLKLNAPAFFVLGFLFIFVLGGLTGVMLAMVPFNQQVHDTHFVVAHLHYVLIGGMVFPLLAAIYYWMPMVSRRRLSERLGKIVAVLLFTGVNLTFFPMHITGLIGMPRRVYTYPEELGAGDVNLLSTIGAFTIAASVALFLLDFVRTFRPSQRRNAGNVWNAGTLEWLPTGNYQTRSIPRVFSREPLWSNAHLARDVEAGAYYLPGTVTGQRETIITSTVDARPQYILNLPGPGWAPFIAAVFTAGFFLLLTVKAVIAAAASGVLAIAAIVRWMWPADPGPVPSVDIGDGIKLPVNLAGRESHSWMATIVLTIVLGAIFASLVFAHFFLWTSSEEWIPEGVGSDSWWQVALSGMLLAAASGAGLLGRRHLRRETIARGWLAALVVSAGVAALAAFGVDLLNVAAAGIVPHENAYSATIFAVVGYQGAVALAAAVVAAFTAVRILAGRVDSRRRATFDVLSILLNYVVVQGFVALFIVHPFPEISA